MQVVSQAWSLSSEGHNRMCSIYAYKPVIRQNLVMYNLEQEVILIHNTLSHKNFNVPSKA